MCTQHTERLWTIFYSKITIIITAQSNASIMTSLENNSKEAKAILKEGWSLLGDGVGCYLETKWNVSRTSGFEKGVIFARVGVGGGGGYLETKWNVSTTSGFEKGLIFLRGLGEGEEGGGGVFGNKMECFQNKRFYQQDGLYLRGGGRWGVVGMGVCVCVGMGGGVWGGRNKM